MYRELERLALPVLQGQMELQVLPARLVYLEPEKLAQPAPPEPMALLELLVLPVPERREPLVLLEPTELRARQVLLEPELRAPPDPPGPMVLLGPQDLLERMELREPQDPPEPTELRVLPVLPASTALRERLALPGSALPALQALLVLGRLVSLEPQVPLG